MTDPTPFDLDQELRRHGGSLRRLALELLRDGAAAADAVQEAWLHAVRRPPRDGAQAGGWLATVLRRAVARSRRSERRRRAREAAVARAPVVGDHAEAAARSEQMQRLLAAVDGLEEPYRSTIWQRYFEALPPRVIAARTGVALVTVKSRLQRGLQQLRQRLGRDGAADWRPALAAAFGCGEDATAAAGATAWTGGLLMATGTKMVAAIVVAAIAVAAWWPRDLPAPRPEPAGVVAAGPTGVLVAADDPAVPTTGRELAAAGEDQPSPAPLARRRGRVVDAATAAPLAGATVVLGYGMRVEPEPTDARLVTDADGRFEFAFAGGTAPRLWCWGPGHVRVWRDGPAVGAGQIDDLGDVPLRSGRILAGRLTDELGMPLPTGTIVGAHYRSDTRRGRWSDWCWVQAPTGVDGAFVFPRAVAPGAVELELPGQEWELVAPTRIEVGDDPPAALSLTARPRTAVRGVVVDTAGVPLAGIGIARLPSAPDAVTGGDGTFVLRKPNRSPDQCTIRVVGAPDFLPLPPHTVAWGTHDVRLVLVRANVLAIEVVDDGGAAVAEFGVELQREGLRGEGQDGTRQQGAHAGGRLDVTGIAPGATLLRVVPSDPALAPSAWLPIVDVTPRRIELGRRQRLVVAVTCGGRPVAGAKVTTLLQTSPLASVPRAPAERVQTALANQVAEIVDRSVTAADGTASLWCDRDPPGRCLLVERDGSPPHALCDFDLPASAARLQVEVPGTGAIAGRVHRRGVSREAVGLRLRANGQPDQRVVTEPDGTFRSRPLAAGAWEVELVTAAPLVASRRRLDVPAGGTATVEYDLGDFAPASVHGRLVRAGALPPGLCVELFCLSAGERPQSMAIVPVAGDGAFHAENLLPGSYRLGVRAGGAAADAPPSLAWVPGLAAETFVLAHGEQLWLEVPFPPRRLIVRLQRADGGSTRQLGVLARCGDAQWPSLALSPPVFDDVVVLDPAPALPIQFRLAAGDWSPPVVMPSDRAEAEVTVVLPPPQVR